MKNNLVRKLHPLVVNITNQVTINDVANILTLIGASPIMTSEKKEAADLLKIIKNSVGSLVVNIGTINDLQRCHILEAVKIANKLEVKVILDPVGAGASRYRTDICLELLTNYKINIVRGNFSEINALYGANEVTRGVDSVEVNDYELALKFAKKFGVVTVISGRDDFIADSRQQIVIKNRGCDMLPKISGTGCMLTSIIGAYAAVYNEIDAAKLALEHLLTASEVAGVCSESVIEFKNNLFKEVEKYGKL